MVRDLGWPLIHEGPRSSAICPRLA